LKTGWLVNDCLTCIPGTRTLWHDLLENVNGLVDKTNTYTNFNILPNMIEKEAMANGAPDYIIRNCTFFRKLNIQTKTISLLQDYYANDCSQIEVANSSDIVVFNSNFTFSLYKNKINKRVEIIPLGVDSDFFKPVSIDYSEELGILSNSILFVGANNNYPKGFDLLLKIIDTTNYNFCLVMKDDYKLNHKRVKVFNRVSQHTMLKIYNSCKLSICTSVMETQHLSGIEGAMCGLPIVATNVGAYFNLNDGLWGVRADSLTFVDRLNLVFNNLSSFSPRQFFMDNGYTKSMCMNRWNVVVNSL